MGARDYEAPIVNGRVEPSTLAQTLLLEGHQAAASRAFLVGSDGMSRAPLSVVSGSVDSDPSSSTRRSASLTILARWPSSSASRLTPYGTRVQVQRGIRVAPDAIEWLTLMTGPVVEASQDEDAAGAAQMSFPLKDEMAMIARDRFDTNTSTDTTLTVAAQMTAIIRRTLPSAEIIDLSGELGQAQVGKLDMQKDPAAGLGKIATAAGLEVFCGRGFQQFVYRTVPSLDDPPRWIISENNDRANLIKISRKRALEGTYNRVFAYGETNDTTTGGTSTPPVSGEAAITDTADPLYYGGPAGRATRFFSSPLIQTPAQATAAAAGLLAKLRGGNLTTSFETLVNPAAESGDVILALLADGRSQHIFDKVGVPLGEKDSQSTETRGIDLPDETAAAA